jgi:hypothetical protein
MFAAYVTTKNANMAACIAAVASVRKCVGIKQLEEKERRFRVAYASDHSMMQRSVIDADLAVAPLSTSSVMDNMEILGTRDGFSLTIVRRSADHRDRTDPAKKVAISLIKAAFE